MANAIPVAMPGVRGHALRRRERRRDRQHHPGERQRECGELHDGQPLVEEHRGHQRDQRRMQVQQQCAQARRRQRKRGEERERLTAVAERAEQHERARASSRRERDPAERSRSRASRRRRCRSAARAGWACRRRSRTRRAQEWPSHRTPPPTRRRTPCRWRPMAPVSRRHFILCADFGRNALHTSSCVSM